MKRSTLLTLGLGATALTLAGAAISRAYSAAIKTADEKIQSGSRIVQSRFGAVQYAEVGSGQPVLAIHGAGGGFDQGLILSRPLIDKGYRVIAPSRFGYLGSSTPADPSPANQADAFVDLLDSLGVDRAAVFATSGGAPSAIQMALRYPNRCSALILMVPGVQIPGATARMNRLQLFLIETFTRSDFLLWVGLSAFRNLMIGTVLGTDPALLKTATSLERAEVEELLQSILPVSKRAQGLLNEVAQTNAPPEAKLGAIKVPTLVISSADDRYGTMRSARFVAQQIGGSRLIAYPTGGHVLIGHGEHAAQQMDDFLKQGPRQVPVAA